MKRILIVLSVLTLVMTGCGVKELTEMENDKIAEYIAASLLKYDANYEDSLEYDKTLLEPTPAPTPTPAPVVTPEPAEGKNGSSTAGGDVVTPEPELSASKDFSDIFEAMGCNVKLKGFEVVSSYNTDYSVLEPSKKGTQLLIVKCQVTNTSGASKKISLDNSISYEVEMDEGEYAKPLLTMTLTNDLQNFEEKIGAGKSKDAVLVFETTKKDIGQISLTATQGTKKVMSRVTGK